MEIWLAKLGLALIVKSRGRGSGGVNGCRLAEGVCVLKRYSLDVAARPLSCSPSLRADLCTDGGLTGLQLFP